MKMSRRKRRVLQMEALQKVVGYQSRNIQQLTGDVFKLKTLLNNAREKGCVYQNEACMYQSEVADLTVRCKEIEEMLRQEEVKHEISQKKCNQYIEDLIYHKNRADSLFEEVVVIKGKIKSYEKDIERLVQDKLALKNDLDGQVKTTNSYKIMYEQQKEMKNMYFGALNKCAEENNELKIELAELKNKKSLLKRVFGWQ